MSIYIEFPWKEGTNSALSDTSSHPGMGNLSISDLQNTLSKLVILLL